MRRIKFIILFVMPLCAYSQWDLIFTYDKPIYAIDVVNPDTVYVAGKHCAIRTFDSGDTWTDINYNFNDIFFGGR